MAITAATRTDIIELVVTALNAAPGTTLLNELVAIVDGGGTLADVAANLVASDTFTARYPAFQTAEEFADEWLGNLIPEAGADALAEAKALVVSAINGGTSTASLMLQAQDFLSTASATDAAFGTSVANFSNKVEVASHQTLTKETAALDTTTLTSVTSDDATVTSAKTTLDTVVVAGSTFTLTTGVDTGASFTGTAGADTYNATALAAGKATLTSGDSLTGGEGTDRLTLTSSVAGTYGNGAIGNSIEELAVTATAATVVDASLMTAVTDIYNIGSTSAGTVDVTGAAGIPNVHMSGTNSNTSVTFANAGVNGGAADSTTVALSSSGTTADTSVTINGVETINVATSGSMSGTADSVVAGALVTGKTVTIASDTLKTLAVTGDSGARLSADLVGATTTITGTITSAGGADDISFNAGSTDAVSVDMGAGNDTVRLQTAPGLKTGSTTAGSQTIAGGEGTDTLVTGVAVSKAGGSNISGFETLRVTNASAVTLDAAKNDISHLIVDASSGTIKGVEAGATIDLTTAGSATLDKTTTGAITVNVGTDSLSGAQTSSVSAAGVTSATINNLNLATDTASARSSGVAGAALTTMTVTGAQATTITGGGAALTKVDATAVSKDVTFSATLAAAGAELIGGAGNDTATGSTGADTLTGGAGNDVLTGGAGNDVISGGDGVDTITGGTGKDTMTGGAGADTFVFSANGTASVPAVNVSTLSATDSITDFVSGTDKLSGTQAVAFLGNFTNIQAALAANNASGVAALSAAFVTGEKNLYVFEAAGNSLSADDLVIHLPNTESVAAGDLLLGSQGAGNAVTLSAAAATATTTTATSATKVTTVKDDTITATVATATGSTVDGAQGTDTLALSIAATTGSDDGTMVANDLDTITNVETITLANRAASTTVGNVDWDLTLAHELVDNGDTLTIVSSEDGLNANGSMATWGVTLTAAEFSTGNSKASAKLHYTGAGANDNITGGEGNDTIIGGDGNDQLTGGAGNDSIDGGAGNDTVVLGATAGTVTSVLKGGAGSGDVLSIVLGAATANLSAITQSGFESIVTDDSAVSRTQTLILDTGNVSGVTAITFDNGGGADTLGLGNGTYDFSSTAITFATAASVLDLNTTGNTAKTLTVDAADIANVATITGESTASIVTTLNLNGTDDLRAVTITDLDVITIAGASTGLTISGDDFSATQFTTVTGTGTGTQTLTIGVGDNDDGAVGDGDDVVGSVDLTNTTVSGFGSIDAALAATTNDLILDASSVSGDTTLAAAAGTDLRLAENGDYTNLTLTSGDFDSIEIATAVTSVTVDEGMFVGTTVVLIDDQTASADPTMTINMVGTTLNMGAVLVGTSNGVDISITGTSGNDTITAADATASGSAFSIATGAGADTVRVEDGSGNALAAATDNTTVADAVRVTDFSTSDQIAVDSTFSSGTSTIVSKAANAVDVDAAAFVLMTSTLNDFTSLNGITAAIGTLSNATAGDDIYVAINNAAGTQAAIYAITLAAATSGALNTVDTDDIISLVAVLDTTSALTTSNMAVY